MKSQRYKQAIKASRDEWSVQFDRCMRCNGDGAWLGLQTHEIERKGQAPNKWAHEVNYLRVCYPCHLEVGRWPHAKQLAFKWTHDPLFDSLEEMLTAWRAIKPRVESYVTVADVSAYLESLASTRCTRTVSGVFGVD